MSQQRAFDFAPRAAEKRNLVIEAGAGTGKTTAIVGEVLRLMLENELLAPERIVLVTFTEKAAGEIADRIRKALEDLSAAMSQGPAPLRWPLDSPNPLLTIHDTRKTARAIGNHLEQIDKLRSQTIHSFCQSLLRTFPLEAGLDPQFKVIEGFERSLLYGQIYDAWLDDETRVHPTPERVAEWELLFEHVGYLFQIRDVMFAMLDRRDLLGEVDPRFGDVSEIENDLLDTIDVVRRCSDSAGDASAQRIWTHLRNAEPPSRTGASSVDERLDQWIAYFEPVADAILEANLPRHNVLKEALRALRTGDKGRSIHERLVSHRAAMTVLSLARRFVDYLDAEKRKLGVVDFDDLLLRTLDLLRDHDVLTRAREQFDHIFVDEFQDTDRTQAEIIDLLARDAGGAYAGGRTTVVGDPKQSIYGFRRADPETYYRMTQRLRGAAAEYRVITDQYRSDPPLLDAVNAIFSGLFPASIDHDPNVFRPEYHVLRAGKGTAARDLDARITLLQVESDGKADRYSSEAEAIAEWIAARRSGGENDLQRFAVLLRRLTNLDEYLDVFERRGIDYVLPPTRLFLDRRAPVDLLAVLRAIAYPFDRGAQISAARSPYFALTDDEIATGILSESVAWREFGESMASFRAAARHRTVAQLIDLVVETTGIESVYEAAADGIRHLRHLEHLRAIAFEYDRKIGGSVRQFVDEITRRRTEPDEMEPSLVDEARNAIRILSVHAAKGLEFETVILPDLAFNITSSSEAMELFAVEEPRCLVLSGRAQSISGNFRLTPSGEKLKKVAALREEAELRRLFYVAVTRAKTDVVFVCNRSPETRNVGFFKILNEILGGQAAWLSDPGRQVQPMRIGDAVIPIAVEKLIGETLTSGPARRRLRDEMLEGEVASWPIVACEIPAPPPPATLSPGEIAARRAGSRNRAAGILLHRVLELWDGTAPYEPLLAQLAAEAAADGDARARVRQRLATIARSPMLLRIARAETVGRELPIRFLENGLLTERRIDRLIREDGRELVIDYKSGLPDPARVARDRDQVARYCTAVSAMTGRACSGAIWYVDLEHDEVVDV